METAIYHDDLKWKPGRKRVRGKASIEEVPARAAAQGGSEQYPEQEEAGPGEVTVKVLRVCANPRLVLCAYSEGGLERRVLVRVKRNAFFRCGMELEARRAPSETEPWSYEGRLPRFAGRW
jgi:hypothetical protein